jgi:alkaline phosphatase D
MTRNITRRTVLKGITAGSLLPLLGGNLLGCSGNNNNDNNNSVPAEFLHGVASGDPLSDAVILWTRVTPEREGDVVVQWELAADQAFDDVVASGSGSTDAAVDYTVKVDVTGLQARTVYYYRFMTGDQVSPVGRTLTAPVGALTAASFAVVSCSNFPAGFFNVYREIAGQAVDAVLHLGDYIYEYGRDGYASERAPEFGRESEPPTEILSLTDYRTRYAQYRGDPDLQSCHAAHPFIVVWDDHEVANDAWREAAENHDPDTEGEYSARRAAAIQAWYEWLPVRPPASEQEIIYRRFHYGDLLDLFMLDTRHVGRDRQVNYVDFASGGVIDSVSARAAVADSNRTLLGADQLGWLKSGLTDSTARWQVLGQQVLMGRQPLPEPIVRALSTDLAGDNALAEATAAVLAAVAAKGKPPGERTPEEQALLDSALPLNPDAWDGYQFEREDILNHALQLQSRLVVLAGDTHNGWASQLTTADGSVAGVELACPSVSSPGAEGVIGTDNAGLFGPFAVILMDDLRYADLVNRGYLALSFSGDEVTGEWRYVSTVYEPDYVMNDEAFNRLRARRDDLLLG